MARNLVIFLAFSAFFIGFASADWNILNERFNKHIVGKSMLKKYCESWRLNVELNNIRDYEIVPEGCVYEVQKYMTSTQYMTDVERAMEEVVLYLSNGCCCMNGDGKDAWIFDVDDTLLSTVPYFKKYGFGGKINASTMEAWMKQSKAPAIEHTLKLYKEIRSRGIKIFLISSRRETLRSSTVDNLIDVGYHGWTNLFLRGLNEEPMEVQRYKSCVRKQLVKQGYRIWGIIGAQWSSLKGYPEAGRTFKLPNSMYYIA